MSTLRKQENEKITTEGEENMTDLSNTLKPIFVLKDIRLGKNSDFNKPIVCKKGNYDSEMQICEHCKGTGVNPKYEKVNKKINSILDYTYKKKRTFYSFKSEAPYCIYCLGEGTIHRKQNNNKKDKKEILANMQYRKNFSKSYSDIEIFLIYVANCETIYDCDKETKMYYDIADDSWKEYNGSYNVPEAKLNLVNYMREFRTDGYFDVNVSSAAEYFYTKIVSKKWIGLEISRRTGFCWCCGRHYTELKPFNATTGRVLLDMYRPLGPYDEEAEKAIEEAYRCCGDDYNAANQWLINKYGREKTEQMNHAVSLHMATETSYECRDCIYLDTDGEEYCERINKNRLSLRL